MFKNGFIKKITIGIASLALVCPLALSASDINTHASAIRYVVPSHNKVNGANNILPVSPNDHVYDNYLNGLYALWNKPSYYKGAKPVTSLYRTYRLAKDQVSFRILKQDPNSSSYYYFQSLHRHHYYAGWVNAKDGAYRDLNPYDTKLRVRTYGNNTYNTYKKAKYVPKKLNHKSNHVKGNSYIRRDERKHVAKRYYKRSSNDYNGLTRRQRDAYYSLNREASHYVNSIGKGNSKNYRAGVRDAFLDTFDSSLRDNKAYKAGFIEFEYLQNKKETNSDNYGAWQVAKANYSNDYQYGAPSIYQQIKDAF